MSYHSLPDLWEGDVSTAHSRQPAKPLLCEEPFRLKGTINLGMSHQGVRFCFFSTFLMQGTGRWCETAALLEEHSAPPLPLGTPGCAPMADPALVIEFRCPQAVLWQLETELRATVCCDHRWDESLGRQTLSLLSLPNVHSAGQFCLCY